MYTLDNGNLKSKAILLICIYYVELQAEPGFEQAFDEGVEVCECKHKHNVEEKTRGADHRWGEEIDHLANGRETGCLKGQGAKEDDWKRVNDS